MGILIPGDCNPALRAEAPPPPPGVSRVDTPTHGLELSIPPENDRDVARGIYDGGDRTSALPSDKPCVLQAKSSPPQGSVLADPHFRGRFVLDLEGSAGLLDGCQNLQRMVAERRCKRLFLGGHNGTDSVGVLDLFYLHPRPAMDPGTPEGLRRLREWRRRLQELPTLPPEQTKQRAREMIFDPNGPCYPGPYGHPDEADNRPPTAAERKTLSGLLACFDQVIDHTSSEQALVMSACGPLEETAIRDGRVGDVGIGQEVCGKLLADALGTRVIYSRGINGAPITRPVYDTSPYGHRVVVPSNWSEIRPRATPPL